MLKNPSIFLKSLICSLKACSDGFGVATLDETEEGELLELAVCRVAVAGVATGSEAVAGAASGALADSAAQAVGALARSPFGGEAVCGAGWKLGTRFAAVQAASSVPTRPAARLERRALRREGDAGECVRVRSGCKNKLSAQRVRHRCGNGDVDEMAYQARSLR